MTSPQEELHFTYEAFAARRGETSPAVKAVQEVQTAEEALEFLPGFIARLAGTDIDPYTPFDAAKRNIDTVTSWMTDMSHPTMSAGEQLAEIRQPWNKAFAQLAEVQL